MSSKAPSAPKMIAIVAAVVLQVGLAWSLLQEYGRPDYSDATAPEPFVRPTVNAVLDVRGTADGPQLIVWEDRRFELPTFVFYGDGRWVRANLPDAELFAGRLREPEDGALIAALSAIDPSAEPPITQGSAMDVNSYRLCARVEQGFACAVADIAPRRAPDAGAPDGGLPDSGVSNAIAILRAMTRSGEVATPPESLRIARELLSDWSPEGTPYRPPEWQVRLTPTEPASEASDDEEEPPEWLGPPLTARPWPLTAPTVDFDRIGPRGQIVLFPSEPRLDRFVRGGERVFLVSQDRPALPGAVTIDAVSQAFEAFAYGP